jgi:hypothetical protein
VSYSSAEAENVLKDEITTARTCGIYEVFMILRWFLFQADEINKN